ncbi:hypothetical protein, conserved [Leishmania tarentolae]|uniref:Uncharacterized protein n=1 Tax=Leishmania tarentolae TaxID=5689 RepID=A0A640K9J5_LEITA|nr:hypothetical protein, conserved [Leishmania tarentolae]
MLGLHHVQQPQDHHSRTRGLLLLQPKSVQLCECGQLASSLQETSQSRTFLTPCHVAAAHHSVGAVGSDFFASRVPSTALLHPQLPETLLARQTHLGHIAGCSSTAWPSSCATPPASDGGAKKLLPSVGNTSAATVATPAAPQRFMADTQAFTLCALSVQRARQLLCSFDLYQRSIGASPLIHNQRRAPLTPVCLKSGSVSAATKGCPRVGVDELRNRRAPSATISTDARGCASNLGIGNAAPPLQASPNSAPVSSPFDSAAHELAKRRSLQVLHDNAQARAAYVDQERQFPRAMHAQLWRQPVMTVNDIAAVEGSISHPTSIEVTTKDGQALPPAAGTGDISRASNASASPVLTGDKEPRKDQLPIGVMSVMSTAELTAAAAEAERALSLLRSIRAVRRQAEELTVLLLHACGEWGCWSEATVRGGPATEQTRTLSPSSPLPGCTRPMQHLFADLFMEAPLTSSVRCTSPSASLLGARDGPSKAAELYVSAAENASMARFSAASCFAKESACRRERACQVLRQALQQQQQRWPLPTATSATSDTSTATTVSLTAGVAFLEMASTPPQRAIPPPPPLSVQLHLYSVHQRTQQDPIRDWRRWTAQVTEAGSTKAGDASSSEEVASLHDPVYQQLHTLRTQRGPLQRGYDVLHTAAAQRNRISTQLRPGEQRGVPSRETTTAVIEDINATTAPRATREKSTVASDAPPEVEAPPLSLPSPPPAAAPDALRHTSSSLPRPHSSATPSSDSQALLSSDTPLSSVVPLAVDHTRPWVDPSTDLDVLTPAPSRGADFLCVAAVATISTELAERVGRAPARQAGPSAVEDASLNHAKGKPEPKANLEGEAIGGDGDGHHASAGASPSSSAQSTDLLRTSFSSSISVDAYDDFAGALRKMCESSCQPCVHGILSTSHDAAQASTAAKEKRTPSHEEERRGRRGDGGGRGPAVALEESVRRHLAHWISEQQTHKESDVASPLSSLALHPCDLSVAAAWLRSTSSRSAVSQPTVSAPPAVFRILKHVLPDVVAPSSWSAGGVAASAAVGAKVDQPGEGEERRAPQPLPEPLPSSAITSSTPSHPCSAATFSASESVKPARCSHPNAARSDPAVAPSPTLSMNSRTSSGGAASAVAMPPGRPRLAPVVAVHPRRTLAPRPASSPKANPAKCGDDAVATKLPQRQRHRSLFSRLFSCGG